MWNVKDKGEIEKIQAIGKKHKVSDYVMYQHPWSKRFTFFSVFFK